MVTRCDPPPSRCRVAACVTHWTLVTILVHVAVLLLAIGLFLAGVFSDFKQWGPLVTLPRSSRRNTVRAPRAQVMEHYCQRLHGHGTVRVDRHLRRHGSCVRGVASTVAHFPTVRWRVSVTSCCGVSAPPPCSCSMHAQHEGQPSLDAAWTALKRNLQRCALFVLVITYFPATHVIMAAFSDSHDQAVLDVYGCVCGWAGASVLW